MNSLVVTLVISFVGHLKRNPRRVRRRWAEAAISHGLQVNMGVAALPLLQVLYGHPIHVRLPQDQGPAFVAVLPGGFTFDEIASLFGLSRTEARFSVHRAYIVANL